MVTCKDTSTEREERGTRLEQEQHPQARGACVSTAGLRKETSALLCKNRNQQQHRTALCATLHTLTSSSTNANVSLCSPPWTMAIYAIMAMAICIIMSMAICTIMAMGSPSISLHAYAYACIPRWGRA